MANIYRNDEGNTESVSVQVAKNGIADGAVVVPSDTVNLAKGVTKGIYVGGMGNLNVDLSSGVTLNFKGLASGMVHPINAKRIRATGTTATDILAVY